MKAISIAVYCSIVNILQTFIAVFLAIEGQKYTYLSKQDAFVFRRLIAQKSLFLFIPPSPLPEKLLNKEYNLC